MKILSYRQQVVADHSSTNYLFYSPTPLSKQARAVVSKLSSHVDVSAHTAEITYHGEFADLGEDRRKKFLEHYEVEVRESYDWWDFSIMRRDAPWGSVSWWWHGTETFTPVRICTEKSSKPAT